MRIGILQTGSVSTALAARHGDYPEMFRALLTDSRALPPGVPRLSFVTIDAREGVLPEPDACHGYVITGSRHSVYDPLPWIEPLVAFVGQVLARRRRVVGICFGHQLLAHHFGGEVRRADAGWGVGVHQARVVAPGACWMVPPAETFSLLVSHQDQVVKLPPGARTFAVADHCPLAGFVMGDALAIQGHPEFTRGYAAELMASRREVLGEDVYRSGIESLNEPVDDRLVAGWILGFLAGGSP